MLEAEQERKKVKQMVAGANTDKLRLEGKVAALGRETKSLNGHLGAAKSNIKAINHIVGLEKGKQADARSKAASTAFAAAELLSPRAPTSPKPYQEVRPFQFPPQQEASNA